MKEKMADIYCLSAEIIGVAATAAVASFCTAKAIKKKKKLDWKVYIPTFAVAGATIAVIVFNKHLNKKQMASIISAGGMSAKLLDEYTAKTKELIGEEKYQEITKAIAKDHEDGIPYAVVPAIDACGLLNYNEDIDFSGEELFYDILGNKWFRSSMSAVRMAEYHLNRNHTLSGCVPLSMFYEFLGVPFDEADTKVGWGFKQMEESDLYWIDFEHTKAIKEDTGEEYTIIAFSYAPEPLEDEI